MLNVVLFGPPGAGKGTQSARLIEKYNLIHLSTGDILRAEVAAQTSLGKEAKLLMDKGILVSDSIVIGMIDAKISNNMGGKGFIFDGFPRTLPQAESLDKLLAKHLTAITMTLALEVNETELFHRISLRGKLSGRIDDQDEATFRKRMSVYNNETSPLKDYYKKQGKLRQVNGMGEIDDIFKALCEEIDKVK
ncbi:MAG: adenylate kinase [Bacteroidia bacterium]